MVPRSFVKFFLFTSSRSNSSYLSFLFLPTSSLVFSSLSFLLFLADHISQPISSYPFIFLFLSFSFFLFHLPLRNCFFQSSLSTLSGISFMQMAALLVSSVSVVTKEALYHYTLKVGNGSNSDSVSTTLKRTLLCDW